MTNLTINRTRKCDQLEIHHGHQKKNFTILIIIYHSLSVSAVSISETDENLCCLCIFSQDEHIIYDCSVLRELCVLCALCFVCFCFVFHVFCVLCVLRFMFCVLSVVCVCDLLWLQRCG